MRSVRCLSEFWRELLFLFSLRIRIKRIGCVLDICSLKSRNYAHTSTAIGALYMVEGITSYFLRGQY